MTDYEPTFRDVMACLEDTYTPRGVRIWLTGYASADMARQRRMLTGLLVVSEATDGLPFPDATR